MQTQYREPSGSHFMDYLSMKNLPLTEAAVRVSPACSLTIANIEHAPNDGIWFDPIDDLVISIVLRSDNSRVTRDVGKGKAEFRYKPGSILLTPASTPSYWRFEGRPQVLHLSLPFQSALELVNPPASDAREMIDKVAGAPLDDSLIAGVAKRMWTMDAAGCGNPGFVERGLGLIMDLIFSQGTDRRQPAPRRTHLSQCQINKVLHIMSERKLRVSVGELAAGLGLSTDHFIRSFKAATGLSPGQKIRHLCLQEGIGLLRQRRLSMTEIAMELGFSSSSHFSAFFKAQTGASPSEWLAKTRLDS